MKRVLQADLADELSKDLISGKFVAGDTIYTDLGEEKLVFSKEPFPVESAAESSAEDKAEAEAVAQEKNAGGEVNRKRSRRGKKKGADAGAEDTEATEGTVAELKKATQDLLDATRSQGEGALGEVDVNRSEN
jgi:ATP-dependent Clp protease ATP-binding subunit ClpB